MEDQDQLSDEQRRKMLQFMTTEHSALQVGRSATIFETGARAAAFLGIVSSALVALAFIGQVSRLGTAFFAFALVLLPTLFFVGLATFERALQSAIEDTIYARGISRIRHFYVEMVHRPRSTSSGRYMTTSRLPWRVPAGWLRGRRRLRGGARSSPRLAR
jgi:hypothetical protein